MKETNEQEKLKSYILGTLSDEDRSAIEERIMTDDDYFQTLTVVEEDLIQEYADGNLDTAEREHFEKRILHSADNRQKVKFARALRKYVNENETLTEPKKTPSFIAALKAFFSKPVPATLAVLIILGIAGFFIWKNFSGSEDSEILLALNKAYKNDRPTEARITGFDYAPKIEGTRGSNKDKNLDLVFAKSRAAEEVLKNQTAENLHELGRVFLAEHNFDEAIKQFEKAVDLEPENAKLRNDLGAALMEKANTLEEGKLELLAKANEEFSKAIEADKNLPAAYFNRALVIQALNLPSQAREAWQKYLELDSTSRWAEEARENLKLLETNKPISKTKEEVLQEFLEAKQTGDNDKAWRTLSRNREMITGKLIPQQLAFLFIDAKSNTDNTEAEKYLDALVYAGKLEEEKAGDPYWRDIAVFYSTVPGETMPLLKEAHDSVRKGYQLSLNNQYDQAKTEFQNAGNLFHQSNNSWEKHFADYWLGYVLFLNNEVGKSNDLLDEVAEFSQERNYKWLLSQAFLWLSINANSSNKFSKSIEYDKRALQYAEAVSDLYNVQKILSQTADHLQQVGQYTKALNYAQRGLQLGVLPETSLRQKWRDYDFASVILYNIKFYNTAEIYQREALNLSLNHIENDIFSWLSYTYLGSICEKLGKFDEAERLFEKGREAAEKFDDSETRKRHLAYIDLQVAHSKRYRNKCSEAIENYDKALKFYQSADYRVNEYEARKGKLHCYLINKDSFAFDQEFPIILSLFNKYRSEILEEQNRNSFFDNEQDVYDIAIAYEFNRANLVNAFQYSEESRSRSLLDLQNSIVEISKEEKHPEIKFSSKIFEPLNLEQIRAEMPENVQLLEYTVLNDKVLIWLITKDDLSFAETKISSDNLREKVLTYVDLVSKNTEPDEQRRLAGELYQILISPIQDKLDAHKEICIIPDKVLFILPFATLSSENYFIEEYKFFYAPSANVFLICSKKAKELRVEMSETLLSIGNPSFNQKTFEELAKLPSASQEAIKIKEFYDKSKSMVFTEKAATKERVKENLKKADVIHFAGHYIVDENSPLLSSLVLAGNEKEDSSLPNYEIIGEKLSSARLIVLSACRTGVERYYNGEGMIGASRTFLATGIPLVVASQWDVDSEATKELMIAFHRYRKKENLSTVAALRRSQLEMMKNEKFNRPHYWAAFAALGGYSTF